MLHEPIIAPTLIESLKTTDFWLMYIMLIGNSACGVLTLSKLADICQKQFAKDSDLASTIVSVNSAFNLLGRVGLGALSDWTGRKPLFVLSLVVQFVLTLFTPVMIQNQSFWPFCISIWTIQVQKKSEKYITKYPKISKTVKILKMSKFRESFLKIQNSKKKSNFFSA